MTRTSTRCITRSRSGAAAALCAGLWLAVSAGAQTPASAPAPSWQQGRSADQSSSTLHPIAPHPHRPPRQRAAARQAEGPGRLQGRGLCRRHPRGALARARRQGDGVRQQPQPEGRLRDRRAGRQTHGHQGAQGPELAERRRLPQRHAVRGRARSHHGLRGHRGSPRQPARAEGGDRQPRSLAAARPLLEVPRLRPRRQALLQRRRAGQHRHAELHAGDDQSRRPKDRGDGGLRERRAQLGRLRLAPDDQGPLVHQQRARLGERRPAARHAASRAEEGDELRLSVLPPRRPARPRVRQGPSVQRVRRARRQAGRARRPARHALLHGRDVPRRVPQQHVHRDARLVGPHHQAGL